MLPMMSINIEAPDTNHTIVCWGDSMTEGTGASEAIINTDEGSLDVSGMTYPDILQRLTGMQTYNMGVYGADSEEIAIMQGGLPPQKSLDSYEYLDEEVMSEGQKAQVTADVLVLEIGSNGGWENYEELIAQYQSMLDYTGCENYIIVGDTDDPINSADPITKEEAERVAEEAGAGNAGSAEDTNAAATGAAETVEVTTEAEKDAVSFRRPGVSETSWERALSEAFGTHFINTRVFILENWVTLTGLEETFEDKEMEEWGNIPSVLRADWTHFNSYGYYVQAVGIYEKGLGLGYWK